MLFNGLVCLVILSAAVAAIIWINRTEPVAQKLNATRKSAALVETVTVRRGTYSPRLIVMGTVQAAQQISLRPRVEGQVIELSPEFVPGGMVRKDELLLRIDSADFENALSINKSELEQAQALMEIEQARQRLAGKELELLGNSIGETNLGLVMREPQIASTKAEVSAARSRSRKGQTRSRTHKNPCAIRCSRSWTRSVNIGSQVGPGDELGPADRSWTNTGSWPLYRFAACVGYNFPANDCPNRFVVQASWIQHWKIFRIQSSTHQTRVKPPGKQTVEEKRSTMGSKVILRNSDGWGPETSREAIVSKLIGTLDQQTRLAAC